MSNIELANLLTNVAKKFAKEAATHVTRNNHMNDLPIDLTPDQVDKATGEAYLVGFINYAMALNGIDLALYTSDLHK